MLFHTRSLHARTLRKIEIAASRNQANGPSSDTSERPRVHRLLPSQGDTCNFTPAPQCEVSGYGTRTDNKRHSVYLISTGQERMGQPDHIIEKPKPERTPSQSNVWRATNR